MTKTYTEQAVIAAVQNPDNISVSMVLKALGLNPTSGTHYKNVWMIIRKLGLNTSHFKGKAWQKGQGQDQFPLEEFLRLNGRPIASCKLKFKLFKYGLKVNKCEICGISEWLSKPLPTELHHVNGQRCDNRLENLKVLCANCHGQTPNFCKRNRLAT